MSVEIEVFLDLQEAEKAANEWQDNFVKNAKQITNIGEDEIRRYAKTVGQELEKSKQKWESFANEARGFIGDVGDAVGALGKGLFGLSESQQVVADKTIYMTEKGMALGGALGSLAGPLGTLVGSGIGAGVGGLLGYFAGNSEAAAIEAENLKKKIKEQEIQLKRTLQIWANADKVKQGVTKLSEAWDMLEKDIKKTIDAEDLSAIKSDELTRRQAGAKEILAKALDGFGKKRQELAQLETEIERAKVAEYASNEERESRVAELEKDKIKREEDLTLVSRNITAQQEEYNATTSELESRTKAAAKATKDFSAVVRDHADTIMDVPKDGVGYLTEDSLQVQLDMLAFLTKLSNDEIANIKAHNAIKEAEAQRFKEAMDNIRQGEVLRGIKQQEEALAIEAAAIEAYANTVNSALDSIGQMSMNAIGGVATDAFNSWLEAVASGEKDADKSFKKIAASAIRNIGQELVADGVKNILQGSANIITGRPAGAALVGIGTAEVAAGIGMGAAGARAQRRQGYGDENKTSSTSGTLGRAANNNAGTQVQAPSIINLGLLAITDQRQLEQAGRQIAQAQSAYAQGRR